MLYYKQFTKQLQNYILLHVTLHKKKQNFYTLNVCMCVIKQLLEKKNFFHFLLHLKLILNFNNNKTKRYTNCFSVFFIFLENKLFKICLTKIFFHFIFISHTNQLLTFHSTFVCSKQKLFSMEKYLHTYINGNNSFLLLYTYVCIC